MILKIYGPQLKGLFARALGQKPEFTKLVSKMINHVYLIYHGEISSTQIASFLHLAVIKINRLYTFFREKCEKILRNAMIFCYNINNVSCNI